MDWESVSVSEVIAAMGEVEWRLRPLGEFASFGQTGWSMPTVKELGGRMKSNAYYYRTNYGMLAVAVLILVMARNLIGLASFFVFAGGLCLTQDSIALSTNEFLLKVVKKVHKPTALKLRALVSSTSSLDGGLNAMGGSKKRGRAQKLRILWLPRSIAVILILTIGLWFCYRTAALRSLAWSLILGLGLPLAHSCARKPNAKVKLSNAREEFRAVWRGYQSGLVGGSKTDYTQ